MIILSVEWWETVAEIELIICCNHIKMNMPLQPNLIHNLSSLNNYGTYYYIIIIII